MGSPDRCADHVVRVIPRAVGRDDSRGPRSARGSCTGHRSLRVPIAFPGIGADGRAFLCEQMKMSEEFVVGDLSVQSIQEVWNSPRLLDFIYPERERFEGTICRQCPEFEKCMWESGRCYRDAYFCYGTIYDSPPLCPYNSRPGVRLS